ncbi:MAG: hypothetical protein V1811_01200, partial [Candidatus Micrarchaeota archaeon]
MEKTVFFKRHLLPAARAKRTNNSQSPLGDGQIDSQRRNIDYFRLENVADGQKAFERLSVTALYFGNAHVSVSVR